MGGANGLARASTRLVSPLGGIGVRSIRRIVYRCVWCREWDIKGYVYAVSFFVVVGFGVVVGWLVS